MPTHSTQDIVVSPIAGRTRQQTTNGDSKRTNTSGNFIDESLTDEALQRTPIPFHALDQVPDDILQDVGKDLDVEKGESAKQGKRFSAQANDNLAANSAENSVESLAENLAENFPEQGNPSQPSSQSPSTPQPPSSTHKDRGEDVIVRTEEQDEKIDSTMIAEHVKTVFTELVAQKLISNLSHAHRKLEKQIERAKAQLTVVEEEIKNNKVPKSLRDSRLLLVPKHLEDTDFAAKFKDVQDRASAALAQVMLDSRKESLARLQNKWNSFQQTIEGEVRMALVGVEIHNMVTEKVIQMVCKEVQKKTTSDKIVIQMRAAKKKSKKEKKTAAIQKQITEKLTVMNKTVGELVDLTVDDNIPLIAEKVSGYLNTMYATRKRSGREALNKKKKKIKTSSPAKSRGPSSKKTKARLKPTTKSLKRHDNSRYDTTSLRYYKPIPKPPNTYAEVNQDTNDDKTASEWHKAKGKRPNKGKAKLNATQGRGRGRGRGRGGGRGRGRGRGRR